MNEQILIPYLGSFLSLFLIGIQSLTKGDFAHNVFSYMIVLLSALNIILCVQFGASDIFLILNGGLIVYGAGGLFAHE